tara:strand:- start:7909 stop:8049 length:141 start_codon:yes stop_codon:yes gene_type:complete
MRGDKITLRSSNKYQSYIEGIYLNHPSSVQGHLLPSRGEETTQEKT